MEFSREAAKALHFATKYAKENNYEFVTPEMLLLAMLEDDLFAEAFKQCGGDIDKLTADIIQYNEEYVEKVEGVSPSTSIGLGNVMLFAAKCACGCACKLMSLGHFVHGLWNLDDCYAVYFLEKQGITESDLLQQMSDVEESLNSAEDADLDDYDEDENENELSNGIEMYSPCLNDTLNDVNPLIGRETELDRTIQILCRKDKNNPLHIGEPGVGKTAITYGLVQLINSGNVPEPLVGAKVFALDLAGVIAGTQYRGEFEKRFKKVLFEIGKEEKPIIYIDEIHNLSGTGATSESSFDASNLLKPYLTDGHIRFIGATTFEEYKKHFEKNKSMVRRFQNVEIKEPSLEETIEILNGLKSKYEKFHRIKYLKGVIEYAVEMSAKHIHERFLPDKAIDLIDEAGAYRRLHPTEKKLQTVDKKIINEVLTTICRVPIETVTTDDLSGLSKLESKLKNRIFGQDEAILQVVNAVKFSKAGLLEENKPLASLLFVGPTGVGKTEIARCLSDELGLKLVRFDMSEYGEKHTVAKLIGSPAGYVGYEEGGLLTEAVRKTPSAVLLLDEIEKAHSDIYNILLQVMDYATLTDNQGRKADFKNIIVIMTSNAGANKLGKKAIGFHDSDKNNDVITEAVKQTFQPEFRNRLNKIVTFNSMNDDMAFRVVDKKLAELSLQLKAKNIVFEADETAKKLIKEKGTSQEFGAREIDRVIRNDVKPLFVDEILFGKLKKGGCLTLSVKDGNFIISTSKVKKGK